MYSKRRLVRFRMMRRNVFINNMKDVATTIKSFIPELIAAVAFAVVVFYLMPIFLGVIAVSFGEVFA